MTDTTIFGNNPADPPSVVDPPKPQFQLPDSVAELVGEGKKYASVEKALEALPHAQTHISNLEKELNELREAQKGAMSAEEVLRAIQELKDKPPTQGAPSLDPDALAKLVAPLLDSQLTVREAQQRAQANAKQVIDALQAKHGDKAEEVYRAKAQELGISVQKLNELASESPKAALLYFGAAPVAPQGTRSTVNTSALDLKGRSDQPPKPTKSLMGGATSAEIQAYFQSLDPRNR